MNVHGEVRLGLCVCVCMHAQEEWERVWED